MIREKISQAKKGKKLVKNKIKLKQEEMLVVIPKSTEKEVQEWSLRNIPELRKKKNFETAVVVTDVEYDLNAISPADYRLVAVNSDEISAVLQYLSIEKDLGGNFFDNRIYVVSLDGTIGNFELRGLNEAGYFEKEHIIKKWIFGIDRELL